MQFRQLAEGVRVGGIAARGLLFGGQAERIEENAAQLLRAVQVERRNAAERKDLVFQLGDLRVVLLAQPVQLVAIDEETVALHVVKRGEQRQLDIAVEPGHLLLVERALIGKRLLHERGGACRRFVFAVLRREQILHELVVVKRRGDGDVPRRKLGFQPLCTEEHERARARQQGGERLGRAQRIKPAAQKPLRIGHDGLRAVFGREGNAVLPHEQRDARGFRQRGDKGGNGGFIGQRQLVLPDDLRHVGRAIRRVRTGKLRKAAGQRLEAELLEQRQHARHIAEAAILQRHVVQRHVARDGCDFLAHQAGHAPVEQLFALLALEIGVGMIERVFQRAVGGQQPDRRFFTDAGNAGDVVACVAHQPLEIGNLRRGHAEILEHLFRRVAHHVAHAAPGVEHAARFGDELHGIAVARDEQGGNPRFLAAAGKCAEDIVGLEGRAGQNFYAHFFQTFAHKVELRTQLRRGRLAARLVFAVILMAESRPVQIKRDRQIARLFVADDLKEHGKKAENGIGIDAVRVGKRRKGVKSAVHEAVAIDNDKGVRL